MAAVPVGPAQTQQHHAHTAVTVPGAHEAVHGRGTLRSLPGRTHNLSWKKRDWGGIAGLRAAVATSHCSGRCFPIPAPLVKRLI